MTAEEANSLNKLGVKADQFKCDHLQQFHYMMTLTTSPRLDVGKIYIWKSFDDLADSLKVTEAMFHIAYGRIGAS